MQQKHEQEQLRDPRRRDRLRQPKVNKKTPNDGMIDSRDQAFDAIDGAAQANEATRSAERRRERTGVNGISYYAEY